MQPPGPVRIGKNRIRVGQGFEQYEFEYVLREGRQGRRILVLRSPSMQLELYKLTDYPGDIKDSRVCAPIREFTPEQVSDLKQKYTDLKRASRERGPKVGEPQSEMASPNLLQRGQ